MWSRRQRLGGLDAALPRARLARALAAHLSNPHAAPRPALFAGPRRFFALPPAERRRWRTAWWRLLVSDLGLRLRPERTLERALAEPAGGPPVAAVDADAIARAVASAANHHLWPMRCLPRSIALRRMLAGHGVAARVRIGVRREAGVLAAHAWVEVAGRAIGEPEPVEERFVAMLGSGEGR